MAIVFHSGFEMGLFGEWAGTSGTTSIVSAGQRTGAYALRSNPTTSVTFTYVTTSGTMWTAHAAVYFTTLPSADTTVLLCEPAATNWVGAFLKLSDSKIYAGQWTGAPYANLGATGVAVATGQWYLIDVKVDLSANPWVIDVKVNGTACGQLTAAIAASTAAYSICGNRQGPATGDWFYDDVYFGNAAADYTAATDIKSAVVANPNGAGTYQAFDTTTGANHWEQYDDPAGTAVATMDDDYVRQAGKAAVADIGALDSCADIGLAAGDVIDAVNVMIYSLGVGDGTAGIRVRSNAGTDYNTGKDDAPIAWNSVYYALDPAGAAWTQANFDGFQAGKYTASHATDEDLYCVMVFVAYHAGAGITIAKVNGVAWASISKINAAATSAISKLDGVAK